jgi:thymidylate synthase
MKLIYIVISDEESYNNPLLKLKLEPKNQIIVLDHIFVNKLQNYYDIDQCSFHFYNTNIRLIEDILLDIHYIKNINEIIIISDADNIFTELLQLKIVNDIYILRNPSNIEVYDLININLKYYKLIDQQYCYKQYEYYNKEENNYINMIKKILSKGIQNIDRTNIGTLSLFGKTFKYDIRNYRLPLLTCRKIFVKGVIKELLFFISGKTNTKILENDNVNIWKGHTSREFLDSRNLQHLPEGDMGAGYSHMLRHWGAEYINCNTDYTGYGFDQLQYVIDLIKTNPMSRRILFSYWNPSYFNQVALPPCHLLYIFYINTQTNELSCSFTQRSQDTILGLPFNIVSCSILVFIICKLTGYKPGKIIHHVANIHLYLNHIEETKKMILNKLLPFPILYIDDPDNEIKTINDFKYKHFKVLLYNSHKKYKFKMAI